MSERGLGRERVNARSAAAAPQGARFWEAVEREIEALDTADLALFLRAHRLPIEPRPAFARGLFAHLQGQARRRWSN